MPSAWLPLRIIPSLNNVDDILVVPIDIAEMQSTKVQILAAFDARDLGPVTYFLGMEIICDRANRTIKLAQKRMTADLLTKFNLGEAKPLSTPLSTATC